jgi:hypothetical protein
VDQKTHARLDALLRLGLELFVRHDDPKCKVPPTFKSASVLAVTTTSRKPAWSRTPCAQNQRAPS